MHSAEPLPYQQQCNITVSALGDSRGKWPQWKQLRYSSAVETLYNVSFIIRHFRQRQNRENSLDNILTLARRHIIWQCSNSVPLLKMILFKYLYVSRAVFVVIGSFLTFLCHLSRLNFLFVSLFSWRQYSNNSITLWLCMSSLFPQHVVQVAILCLCWCPVVVVNSLC